MKKSLLYGVTAGGIIILIAVGLFFWSKAQYAPVFLFQFRCQLSGGTTSILSEGPFAPRTVCKAAKRFPDAGKVCNRDAECMGECRPSPGPTDVASYPGTCSDQILFSTWSTK